MRGNTYYNQNYDNKSRWISYWCQIREVLSLNPKNVLEIGVGNRTVSDYLKNRGTDIVTVDADESLKPDKVGNILSLPFEESSFDVVLCAEVLEHLPFEDFEKALAELKRVAGKDVVLSLPHFGPPIKVSFKIPFLKEKKLAIKIPLLIRHEFKGDHYWEIGKKGCSAMKIRKIIKRYFKIKKEFIPFENQYHHFFILKK